MKELERLSVPDNNHRIAIIGAGLVGSLWSIFLARRGFSVEVFERRPDMRQQSTGSGRSINLAISARGIQSLAEIGLAEEVLKRAVPMRGRMVHSLTGQLDFQPYGKDDTDCINSISRGELNKTLINRAESTGLAKFCFNQKATAMDFNRGAVTVEDGMSGSRCELRFDHVFATDGAGSAIRGCMAELSACSSSETHLEHGYKELTIPHGPNGEFALDKNALHIWPRKTYMLIALPNFDGSFTCTLFLPSQGPVSFERLDSPQAVAEFFDAQFPDVVPLIPDLPETFFANPVGHMVTVKCNPWYVNDKVLVLGDAAHAMVPFYGQGMNCGFEDCTVLNNLLGDGRAGHPIDWAGLFSNFYHRRKVNADAIADMALENFIEMRDKVADRQFRLRKGVEKILQEKFPGRYFSRYFLVTFTCVEYRLAYDVGIAADQILSELCHNIQSPEEVDLAKAERIISRRLAPMLAACHQSL